MIRSLCTWLPLLGAFSLSMIGCGAEAGSGSEGRDPLTEGAPSAVTVQADTLPPPGPAFPIQSVTLDARDAPSEALLHRIADLGTTHLTLIPFGWQKTVTTPKVHLRPGPGWYSESDRGIRALAAQAEALGMGVILKPHVWIGGYHSDGQARHEVEFDTPADWAAWESSYRTFLLHYARLAQEVQADVLVVGTELHRAAEQREGFWRDLIAEIRRVYDGRLTYAANWYGEYRDVPFWDALDYVGVQAYFPLSDAPNPSTRALMQGWAPHVDSLHALHRAVDRPVLFTEVGYRSVSDAAEAPWRWPEQDGDAEEGVSSGVRPDPALQARCYRAFFATFASLSWFEGAVLWKLHPTSEGDRPIGFTPQSKVAEQVIGDWFGAVPRSEREGP